MSWEATTWAMEQKAGDPTLKLLLLTICNYANIENQTWYSQEKLSHSTEIPIRTLRRKLHKLVELGLISVEERRRENGSKTTSLITVLMQAANLAGSDSQRPKEGGTSGQKRPQPAANMVAGPDSSENNIEYTLRPIVQNTSPPKRRSSIPKEFPMTDRHIQYAASSGLMQPYAATIFENFKNHHAAKGTLMLDWDAAWRTWVGNEIKFSAARAVPTKAKNGKGVYGDDWW